MKALHIQMGLMPAGRLSLSNTKGSQGFAYCLAIPILPAGGCNTCFLTRRQSIQEP